jgi:hypothetical protein
VNLINWVYDGNSAGPRSTASDDPFLLWSPNSVWQTGGGLPGFVTNAITAVGFTETTATYTAAGHTFRVGDKARISGLEPAGYNGVFTVTGFTSDTFTVANMTNDQVSDQIGTVLGNRKQIGAGWLNTIEIQTAGNSADLRWGYNSVLAYDSGTEEDWYIPSVYELRELCKYANGKVTGDSSVPCTNTGPISTSFINSGGYMSSNQSLEEDYRQILTSFSAPGGSGVSGEGNFFYSSWNEFVRPIRAF